MRKNGCLPCKSQPVYEFCDFALTPLDPRPINFADFNARGGGGPRGASLYRSDPGPPPARRSVVVGWSLVLAPRLLVVAALAQRSPVGAVPEESRVASVRNDMVHHCGPHVLATLHTLLAEWMRTKKLPACFLPCAAVAMAGSGPHLLRVQRLVYVTVLGTGRDQCSAAGMPARYLGFHWHTQHLL